MDRDQSKRTQSNSRSLENVFDGSLKLGGSRARVLFITPEGRQLKYVLQILWQATNNEAEYEALILRLRIANSLGIKRLLVYGNSVVMIN